MANSWFKFKQFAIIQDKVAMKVGTDGVILGAWADVSESKTILDVGTGTGLLSLMLAQRNTQAKITAIDIDKDAALQANENFLASEWTKRLLAIHTSLEDYSEASCTAFDFVICNPPFFKNAFKSHDDSRNKARHDDCLSYRELINVSYRITTARGRLAVIIPYQTEKEFLHIASQEGFFLKRLLRVKPTPKKDFVRSVIELYKNEVADTEMSRMIIEDGGRHAYSDDYIHLTKDFYLAL